MKALLILNLIVPCVMIVLGVVLKKYPVKHISGNGYNTPTSRKSQAHWDCGQRLAPEIFLSLGKRLFCLEALLSVAFAFMSSWLNGLIAGLVVDVIIFILAFIQTDAGIRKEVEG